MDNVVKGNFDPVSKAIKCLNDKLYDVSTDDISLILDFLDTYFSHIPAGTDPSLDIVHNKLKEALFWLETYHG